MTVLSDSFFTPSPVLPGLVSPLYIRELLSSAHIAKLNEMQLKSIDWLRNRANLLIMAPTGSGKTEAALLPVLESLIESAGDGIRALYVTPLRALNRNLIDRVQRLAFHTGLHVSVRHGDTPTSDRRKQAASPPDILITTPETLQAIHPGKLMQRHLRHVRYVIIDEVHQLAEDRRGTQLAVALERLRQVADLVAVYGKRAVYACSVYGVGPTTASKILARMQDTDKEFFNDLFEAKLTFITTRPYWNEPRAKPKAY